MAKKSRYGTTRQGLQITNKLRSKNGRKYVVAKRETSHWGTEYIVGCGYDERNGRWAQGVYGFRSRKTAVNYAKGRAYKKY